jgi:membrane associated rhomboid family serine protease
MYNYYFKNRKNIYIYGELYENVMATKVFVGIYVFVTLVGSLCQVRCSSGTLKNKK